MKKDFAIICAANISKRNSGMYSVDLAAQQYFSGLGRSFDLCMTQGDGVVGSLRFRKLRTPKDYLDYKNIVYWGDFQNNPLWGANDYCNKEIAYEGVTDREIALLNWANRYLLLPRMIGSDADVYAIGGSFMGAQEYLSDPAINQPFLYFLSSAKRIIVRDSASYRFLSALSHNPGILQGFDCAALLRMPAARKGSFFVYSFRRTIGKEDARRLVRAVEKATGFKGVAINWLGRKPRLRSPHGNFVRNSRLISQAQFALSDIYHFCINSFGRARLRSASARGKAISGQPWMTTRNSSCMKCWAVIRSFSIVERIALRTKRSPMSVRPLRDSNPVMPAHMHLRHSRSCETDSGLNSTSASPRNRLSVECANYWVALWKSVAMRPAQAWQCVRLRNSLPY